jgi:hypothetical protein
MLRATCALWTAAKNHRPRRIHEASGWRMDGTDRRPAFGGVGFVEVRYRRGLVGGRPDELAAFA